MYPDACSRRRTSRPPCASRLRRFPCTSHRCVPIRTPPCKTRCIRRMPTSCCCRTALLPRNHNPLCTHRAAHLRLPAPDTAACDSAPVPTMSVRFPTVTPPIAISSLPSPATLSPISPIHPPIHRFPASIPGVTLTLRQAPCHGAAHQTLVALHGPASALRRHTFRGAAPASPATEAQGHSPGLRPARGDAQPRGAG